MRLPHPFVRRHHRPGTAPGTLQPPAERRVEKVTIDILRYGPDGVDEHVVPVDDLSALQRYAEATPRTTDAASTVTWVDVTGLHDVELLRRIGEIFGLHALALEDTVNTGQRPKAEDYEGHLYVVTRHFHQRSDAMEAEQISLFLLPGVVLTFQEIPGDAFEPVRERIRRGSGRIRSRGADYLAYALIDALVDGFFPLLETLGERIETLEEELIEDPTPDILDSIYRLRRDLLTLRRAVWPERELINTLLREETGLVEEQTRVFLRDCYGHAVEVLEIVETYRELAAGMLDVYLSSVSQRMNEVMKVLTIIATLFIPLTFVAGVYGMNFANMPELGWRWGYPAVMGLMALMAGLLIWYFKRKGWW